MMVPYTTLLKHLHLPKVHVDVKEPMVCPPDCSQKSSCKRIQETLGLVKNITKALGEKSKVFEGIEVSMIGSTREGSRAFYSDEVDIHLSLNHDLQKLCYFDIQDHKLKKRGDSKPKNPDVAKYFNDVDNTFQPEKFFHDFVFHVHSIISRMELPTHFLMLPLTTVFDPCIKCINTGLCGLQVMRCRHKFDCEQHKRCSCGESNECKCLDECGCREYASPSLTWSKVGVVLHLQWREEDGTLFTIDCDLNCPTWPTYTKFSGNCKDAQTYLIKEHPVGWLEEFSKLEMMTEAAVSAHLLTLKSWPVKFRLINRNTVFSSQTLLFMDDQLLKGKKPEAYVLVKILKYCTGSSARSYQCKYAVGQALLNKSIESIEELGSAIKKIIHYHTIRGKFCSVHPDLAAEGITGVEVGEEGLHFIKNKEPDEVSIHMPENQVIDLEELDEEELLIRAVARMIFKSDRSFPPFE